jgi:hypothetical protein
LVDEVPSGKCFESHWKRFVLESFLFGISLVDLNASAGFGLNHSDMNGSALAILTEAVIIDACQFCGPIHGLSLSFSDKPLTR